MKRIILLELCLIFLATTFRGDNPPPGWYLQTIPVNKNVVDIYFTDTLNGWAVTNLTTSTDTGYVLKTTNGGTNWVINNYYPGEGIFSIQFLNENTGYMCSSRGPGLVYKTTNSGQVWNQILMAGHTFTDLHFLNKDTGWVCDDDNLAGIGLIKTTNGGQNWTQQMDNTYQPKRMFFLNRDTGWVMSYNGKIYRTNNSGNNWTVVYNFGDLNVYSIFFTSSDTGWVIRSGYVNKTINGGYNWQTQTIPANTYPQRIFMNNSNYGYLSTGLQKMMKTIDGINWGKQNAPDGGYDYLFFIDSLKGWSHHGNLGNNDIVATVDGGGPVMGVNLISSEVPNGIKLEQNYPNPFNSITNVKFQILNSGITGITVYDISGRELTTLINKKLSPGTYEYRFDAGILSSGIYFYTLFADGKRVDTKKMILIK